MTSHAMSDSRNERGGGERALRWIGDLDHPFYSDERNRYVWYEASAIGFQMLFLGSYFATGLVLWVAGGAALPYALAMFVPTLATAVVFQTYLKRNSAEYWPGKNDLVRRRGQLGVLAVAFLITGFIRASIDLQDIDGPVGSFTGGAVGGAVTGFLVGPLAAIGVLVYKSRQQAKVDD